MSHELHWADAPVDKEAAEEEFWEQYEEEEKPPVRKPVATFTDRQILLVNLQDKLVEFPMSGDEYSLHSTFFENRVYGYIMNRHPDFEHKHFAWALER